MPLPPAVLEAFVSVMPEGTGAVVNWALAVLDVDEDELLDLAPCSLG